MEENTVINEVIEEAATNTVSNDAGGFNAKSVAAGFAGGLVAYFIIRLIKTGRRKIEEVKRQKKNEAFFDVTDKQDD